MNPLTVTYNAREQTAIQTDTSQHVSPMTFTGRGQWERVSDTDSNGTHTYTYSLLGLTKVVGSTASYVRDPGGSLISQQPASGGPYYYLADGQGSVAGMVDTSGNAAAGYFFCPTRNQADAAWGSAAAGNPYLFGSAYYDALFQSYWVDGQQIDANSGNAFSLGLSPDTIQTGIYFGLCGDEFGACGGGTGGEGEPGGTSAGGTEGGQGTGLRTPVYDGQGNLRGYQDSEGNFVPYQYLTGTPSEYPPPVNPTPDLEWWVSGASPLSNLGRVAGNIAQLYDAFKSSTGFGGG